MFLFIIYVGERLVPGWTPIIDKPLVDFSFSDWLWAFWDTAKIGNQGGLHSPMVLQFWFIRDLMVISLLSPIIYLALKPLTALREEIPAILLIALLIVSRWVNDVPGLSLPRTSFLLFRWLLLHQEKVVHRRDASPEVGRLVFCAFRLAI